MGGGGENEDDHTMWTRSVKSVSLRVRGVDPTRPFLYPFTVDGGTRNCSLCPFPPDITVECCEARGPRVHTHTSKARESEAYTFLHRSLATTRLPHCSLFNHKHPQLDQKKKKKKKRKKDDTYNATIKQPHGSLSRSEVSSNRTVQCTGALDRRPFAHFDIKTLPGGGL